MNTKDDYIAFCNTIYFMAEFIKEHSKELNKINKNGIEAVEMSNYMKEYADDISEAIRAGKLDVVIKKNTDKNKWKIVKGGNNNSE